MQKDRSSFKRLKIANCVFNTFKNKLKSFKFQYKIGNIAFGSFGTWKICTRKKERKKEL